MTQAVIVPGLVAPAPTARVGTLLDTAEVIEGIGWLEPAADPGGIYTSLNCLGLPATHGVCDDPMPALDFSSPELVNVIRFVSDIGFRCQALGREEYTDQQFAHALDLLESPSVESNLMNIRFTGTEGGAAATDITPGSGAVSPQVGLALLEGHGATNYIGQVTVHSPVTIASLLLDVSIGFHQEGNRYETSLGNSFVSGAGYEDSVGPSGSAPAAGEWWMYASGDVRLHRSQRIQIDPIIDRGSNIMYVRSQRIYVADVDCYLAAVRVTLP